MLTPADRMYWLCYIVCLNRLLDEEARCSCTSEASKARGRKHQAHHPQKCLTFQEGWILNFTAILQVTWYKLLTDRDRQFPSSQKGS